VVQVTLNSDDPAYFGGSYVGDNYAQVAETFGLSLADVETLARNSIEASFLSDGERQRHLALIDAWKQQSQSQSS
jgi:adenosine deaminase